MAEDSAPIGEQIKQRRETLGWSQAKLAEASSSAENPVNQQTIGRLETGETQFSRALPAIIAALDRAEGAVPRPAFAEAPPVFPRDSLITKGRLPIYASAQGGPGAEVLSSDPVDYVTMPEPLQNVKDAFGVYIVGDSMSPAFEPGDIVLIHPHRAPRGDDDVMISRLVDGTAQVTVKRLVKSTPERWKLRQFNPAKDFELSRKEWPVCRLVVGKYSRR